MKNTTTCLAALATAACLMAVTSPTQAASFGISRSAIQAPNTIVEEVQYHRRGPVVVRPGFRPGPAVVVRRGGWARPRHFWWGVGGAIAAGAALGYIASAAAAPYAGPPPGPGLCWYYTDWSRRNGFWDVCP